MSDWKTYPQEVPNNFQEEFTVYSKCREFYLGGEFLQGGHVLREFSGENYTMKNGDLWKIGYSAPPPPHSPESAEPTPLVETAAATATIDDEITAEKLRAEEGWAKSATSRGSGTYISTICDRVEVDIYNDGCEVYIVILAEGASTNITTMSELRTLVRWLS